MTQQVFALVLADVRWSFRTRWLPVTLMALIAGGWAAIRLGQRDFDDQRAAYAEFAQARLKAQLLSPDGPTGRAAEPGLRVIRPPNDGAVLVQGQDRLLPAAWDMTAAGAEALGPFSAGRRIEDGGAWDLEVLTRTIASLLALGLGILSALASRSSGWTEAIRGFPVSPAITVLAQLASGCAVLLLVVVVWWTAMSMVLAGGSTSTVPLVGRLWTLAVPTLLMLWIFFGIGAALGWQVRSGSRAMLLAVVAWVVGAVLGPSLVALAAEGTSSVPPQGRFERERREQYADDYQEAEVAMSQKISSRLPGNLKTTEYDTAAQAAFQKLDIEWQRLIRPARFGALEIGDQWWKAVGAQRSFMSWAAWLSPGALSGSALAELAGSGRKNTQDWDQSVLDYEAALNRVLFDDRPLVNLKVRVGSGNYRMQFPRHPTAGFGDLPTFQLPDNNSLNRLSAARVPLAGLGLWAAVALGLAYWSALRVLRA